ncbi:MAG: hypothetical protein ACHQE6_00900 [Solirubrobacterales bacterium]
MSSTIPEPGPAGDRYQSTGGISGWIIFAGVIMLIGGFLDAMWGLAAVINNEVITVGGHGVVVWDITAWGWAHLILGSLVALTGLGLLAAQSWARWLGIIFVTLNVLVQFGTFTLFPLWSMMIIALDIVILYQLTARWEPDY